MKLRDLLTRFSFTVERGSLDTEITKIEENCRLKLRPWMKRFMS